MNPRFLIAAGSVGAVLLAGAPAPAPPLGDGTAAGLPPGRLLLPVTGAIVTQPFGCTWLLLEPLNPQCPTGHFHSGLDLAAPLGTDVRAAAAGRSKVLWNPSGFGLYVLIEHGGGLRTLYGHLSAASVRDGEDVRAGQQIGRVGSSGLSTGPHLHFEVRRDGRPVDPIPYLPANHS
jgi:murein DD-endopeptidase MepM/ murein hydrolase activator NlpD